jgi:hypothetical protein
LPAVLQRQFFQDPQHPQLQTLAKGRLRTGKSTRCVASRPVNLSEQTDRKDEKRTGTYLPIPRLRCARLPL